MAKELEIDETEERDAELEAAFAELGSNGAIRWTVYCMGPRDKVGHLATWEDGMSIDRIAREFGAGQYKVRALGEDGKMLKGGARTLQISSNSLYERERQKAAIAPTVAPVAPQSMGVAELLAFMTSQNQQSMQMMQTMMQAQSNMVTAILSKPTPVAASNGLGAAEVVDMMSNMQTLMKPTDGGSAVDTLLKGIELAQSLGNGGSGGETDFLTLAAKGLDVVGSAIKSGQQPTQQAPRKTRRVNIKQVREVPARVANSQTPKPVQTAPQPQKVETPEEIAVRNKLEWLKRQLAALLHQAKRDSAPELYAAVMLDNLPDFITDDELLRRFNDSSAISQLAMLAPEVLKYAEWFEQFRFAVIEQLSANDEEEEDPMNPEPMNGEGIGDD